MSRDMKLVLLDVSDTTNLSLANKGLEFANRMNAVVSLFDTRVEQYFAQPDMVRTILSKGYNQFFINSAFLGEAINATERDGYFKERFTDLFVLSNLYSGDAVYPFADAKVKLNFIALPGSEGIEWFKGEYKWANVYSWQQAEDQFNDRA